MLSRLKEWCRSRGLAPLSPGEFDAARVRLLDATPVPVFWLFGKTGSGKTSLIKHLTHADEAQIGTGFRPETQQSRRYAFPAAEQPLLEFLDTRGLGEAGYDPQEDIAAFDATAHLMLVTVRAADHAQRSIVEPLRAIRKAKPDRPVILVLTALHDLYPRDDHPQPDPFGQAPIDVWDRQRMPPDLIRSLEEQVRRFKNLVDWVVPVDLTLPEDGFNDPAYGSERLKGGADRVAAGSVSPDVHDHDRGDELTAGAARTSGQAVRPGRRYDGRDRGGGANSLDRYPCGCRFAIRADPTVGSAVWPLAGA